MIVDWSRYNEVIKSIEDVQDQAVQSILTVLGKASDVRMETPVDTQAPAHLGIGAPLPAVTFPDDDVDSMTS